MKNLLEYLLKYNIDETNDQRFKPKEIIKNQNGVLKEIDPGIFEYTPFKIQCQHKIALSCAIHGNETAPIEICIDIIEDIICDKFKPEVPILFIFGNIISMQEGKREIMFNMNRLFSSAHKKYPQESWEVKRAIKIEEVLKDFFNVYHQDNYHFDLHTAIRKSMFTQFAVIPYRKGLDKFLQKKRIQTLEQMGLDAALIMNGPATTLSYYSDNTLKVNSFTIELGKVEPFGQNDRANFFQAEKYLRSVLSNNAVERNLSKKIKLFSVTHELIKTIEKYKLNIPNDFPNFSKIDHLEVLDNGQPTPYVPQKGDHIVFPNENVALKARSGLIVQETSI